MEGETPSVIKKSPSGNLLPGTRKVIRRNSTRHSLISDGTPGVTSTSLNDFKIEKKLGDGAYSSVFLVKRLADM